MENRDCGITFTLPSATILPIRILSALTNQWLPRYPLTLLQSQYNRIHHTANPSHLHISILSFPLLLFLNINSPPCGLGQLIWYQPIWAHIHIWGPNTWREILYLRKTFIISDTYPSWRQLFISHKFSWSGFLKLKIR
jgi:hypothetical protein